MMIIMQYKSLQTNMKQYREMHVIESGRCNGDGSYIYSHAKERHLTIISNGQSNGT